MTDTEPFHLTLRFNAPPGEAAKRAEAIADLCAAEFGTSEPRLTPADGDLRDRMIKAARTHYIDPSGTDHAQDADRCACGELVEDWDAHWTDAVLAVRDTEVERLRARVETLLMDFASEGQRADEAEQEAERLRAELAAYRAAAQSTDLEGDARDHFADLADWETPNGETPEWLVDAVMGFVAPHVCAASAAEHARDQAEAERDAAHAAIERVRRMAQVWVDIRPTGPTVTGDGHVMAYAGQQILAALDASSAPESLCRCGNPDNCSCAPESPTGAPTAPTRPDDTHQPHNSPQDTPQ